MTEKDDGVQARLRAAAIAKFDGSAEGREQVERQARPTAILAKDSKLLSVAVLCQHALMQVEPAERRVVVEWLLGQLD